MTREEHLYWLNKEIETWENDCQSKHPIKEALYVARKVLEQKPCEDAVSRTEVLNLVRFNAFHVKSQIKAIENMPSVTPQEPRKGHWCPQNDDYFDWYECSECGYGSEGEMQHSSEYDVRTNFCPNCGADMREGDE